MNKTNPFESPKSSSSQGDGLNQRETPRWQAMLTRIVVLPFGNILGVILFFPLILPTFVAISYDLGRTASSVLFMVSAAAVVGFDIWWRLSQQTAGSATKLLSLYEGGTFMFLPIWHWGTSEFGLFLAALIIRALRAGH
jgi:hypothetical protein